MPGVGGMRALGIYGADFPRTFRIADWKITEAWEEHLRCELIVDEKKKKFQAKCEIRMRDAS